MSEPADLRARLCAFIAKTYANNREISDETELVDSGIIDSSGIIELLLFLEDEYAIAIPDEMLTPDNFCTVAEIARCAASIGGPNSDDG